MLFDFKCPACGAIDVDVVLSINHNKSDHPVCCFGEPMRKYFTTFPGVHMRDYVFDEPFKAGKGGTVISGAKENREFMKRHDLMDANDLGPPPTYEEGQESIRLAQESIDAITPTKEQHDMMVVQYSGHEIT